MCGFVGQLNFQRHPDTKRIEQASALLHHRGPDDQGLFDDQYCAIGFRRLSIIDLSSAGHQPMVSRDKKLWIVFNGEIYNYLELRRELQHDHSQHFQSQTDTEVILAAYQVWGRDCFQRLNGMWAMAIWDTDKHQLILSRDRFGEKPLYYSAIPGGYIFGSEIKALLPQLDHTPPPNQRMVFDYLAYAFHDHTEDTFFQDIYQVRPGHTLIFDQTDISHPRPQSYWTLRSTSRSPAHTFDQAAEEFRALLTDSIRLRLRSDVPLGSCLSGGLDSSAIVLLANTLLGTGGSPLQQKTFTACSENPLYDERQYSRMVNQLIGAEQNEIIPDPQELRTDFDRLLWHQEEPFLSLSMFAQWGVMRRAKQRGITVLLDGQGGDEVLAGYIPFFASLLAGLVRSGRWPTFVRQYRAFMHHHGRSWPDIIQTLGLYLLPSAIGRSILPRLGRLEMQSMQPDFRRNFFQYPNLPTPFDSQLKNHMFRLLTGTGLRALLHYEDRNSMAWSIEARVPFLDPRLAEFTLSLPDEWLLGDGQTKRLLRRALHDVLPPAIRDRRDKMGFVVPQVEWMRGPLADDIRSSLLRHQPMIAAFVQPEVVRKTVGRFFQSEPVLNSLVWRWYNLEKWLGKFHQPA